MIHHMWLEQFLKRSTFLKNDRDPKFHAAQWHSGVQTWFQWNGVAWGSSPNVDRGLHWNFQTGWWFQPTPLKNMTVSWDDDIPNRWENKTCSKPPISKVLTRIRPTWIKSNFVNLDFYH